MHCTSVHLARHERGSGASAGRRNSYTTIATDFVRHYYESYERYDLISYPVLQSSDVGEELDVVDIVRISPEDAPSLIDERNKTRRKLAGTKLMHFGAFLDRGWRQNDILWGQDGCAAGFSRRSCRRASREWRRCSRNAQLAILEEEYGSVDRDRLCQLLVEGLIAQSSPDKSEAELRALADRELGSPINTALQAVLRTKLTRRNCTASLAAATPLIPT